jgi:hypothetical protein
MSNVGGIQNTTRKYDSLFSAFLLKIPVLKSIPNNRRGYEKYLFMVVIIFNPAW